MANDQCDEHTRQERLREQEEERRRRKVTAALRLRQQDREASDQERRAADRPTKEPHYRNFPCTPTQASAERGDQLGPRGAPSPPVRCHRPCPRAARWHPEPGPSASPAKPQPRPHPPMRPDQNGRASSRPVGWAPGMRHQ